MHSTHASVGFFYEMVFQELNVIMDVGSHFVLNVSKPAVHIQTTKDSMDLFLVHVRRF